MSMGSHKINKDIKSLNTIGVLPMGLAEPATENNDRWSEVICRCSSAMVKKTFTALAILLIAVTVTMIVLTILNYKSNVSEDNTQKEIIVVTGTRDSANVTIDESYMELFLQLKNKSSESVAQRKKRGVFVPKERKNPDVMEDFDDNDMNEARKVIMDHDTPCQSGEQNKFCKVLVEKVNSVKVKKDVHVKGENKSDPSDTRSANDHNIGATTEALKDSKDLDKKALPHDLTKESPHHGAHKPEAGIVVDQNPRFQNPYNLQPPVIYPPEAPPMSNHDSCLLAKLLKQHYPTVEEYFTQKPVQQAFTASPYVYDIPNTDYLEYEPTPFVYGPPESFLPQYRR
ncbi:hypothetical protein EVAR_54622_1 [Eumeta japonica]|uniref:Uncharacterized protein n=1 Tax=Eumeta variegata TaxID=151549 RepID=A0A4C1YMV7_EUMVA|nr:hypothetical protein EVAR_54622_1 [Eumeta japonica]